MQAVNKKWYYRFLTIFLSLLMLAGSFNLIMSTPALAAPSQSIEITGDGVTKPVTFTRAQLEAMEQYQHVYSAINTWPTKKWYVGQGVKLRDLLALAGIKEDARLIRFTSSDSYTITLTVKELLDDQRYCFPHFKDNSTADSDGNVPGSAADAELVEPMIGLISVEGSNNPKYMNDLNSMLLMMGQRAVTEQTGNLFVKYLSKIEVLTTEPDKWDTPQANPGSGEVAVGTMVALSNIHMDDDKVYYTTDGSNPTLNSPMYNWIAKRWWSSRADVLGIYNKPVGPINEDTIIKAITIGPGKLDSDVVTFSYKIGSTTDEEPPVTVTLTDINGHWAQKNIEKLVALGIVSGGPDGRFEPDKDITRAEFAVMLVNAFKLENKGGRFFADTASHWARDYIACLTSNGICGGYDADTFGPEDPITHEQMAVMIAKAAQLAPATEEISFADGSSISPWARDAVAAVKQYGIMNGYAGNTFQPLVNTSKAEAVTAVANALNN